MRPPNERPTRAMRSASPSAPRAARRSSSSSAYSLLGRDPRVRKVTARDSIPNDASAEASFFRIGWSAVPP